MLYVVKFRANFREKRKGRQVTSNWVYSWKIIPLVLSCNPVSLILAVGSLWALPTMPINCSFWFCTQRAVETNYFKGLELAHLRPSQWDRM